MYTRQEREGFLWEFHLSGMSVAEACRRPPLFPNEWNPRRWPRMEGAGELASREMPDRASRIVEVKIDFTRLDSEPPPSAPTYIRQSRHRGAPESATAAGEALSCGARSLVL